MVRRGRYVSSPEFIRLKQPWLQGCVDSDIEVVLSELQLSIPEKVEKTCDGKALNNSEFKDPNIARRRIRFFRIPAGYSLEQQVLCINPKLVARFFAYHPAGPAIPCFPTNSAKFEAKAFQLRHRAWHGLAIGISEECEQGVQGFLDHNLAALLEVEDAVLGAYHSGTTLQRGVVDAEAARVLQGFIPNAMGFGAVLGDRAGSLGERERFVPFARPSVVHSLYKRSPIPKDLGCQWVVGMGGCHLRCEDCQGGAVGKGHVGPQKATAAKPWMRMSPTF